jgi:hypothetical protein
MLRLQVRRYWISRVEWVEEAGQAIQGRTTPPGGRGLIVENHVEGPIFLRPCAVIGEYGKSSATGKLVAGGGGEVGARAHRNLTTY